MMIVKKNENEFGGRENSLFDFDVALPEGWIEIPKTLEEKSKQILPWLTLSLEGDVVVDVCENTEAKQAWEAANPPIPPEPTVEETLLELSADQEYRLCMIELGLK